TAFRGCSRATTTSGATSTRPRCSGPWWSSSRSIPGSVPRRTYNGRVSVPRPLPSSIPDEPGAYLFRDSDGRVLYVGKAKSLRKRLASYWGRPLHARTEAMVEHAGSVEWIVSRGEVDALMLEYSLIKLHRPRVNVR